MEFKVFDFETAALPREYLESIVPPFKRDEVAIGNRTDPEKIEKYIDSLEEKARERFFDKAALYPESGRIVACGYKDQHAKVTLDYAMEEEEEEGLIERFWAIDPATNLIGFNIFSFDLPFVLRRSWYLGIPVPKFGIRRGRYWADRYIDILDEWRLGAYKTSIGLDRLGLIMGLGQKTEDSGKHFFELMTKDFARAEKYLQRDVELTFDVAAGLEII